MKLFPSAFLVILICLAVTVPALAKEKEPAQKTVKQGSKVTLEYSIIANETEVESSEQGGPLVFTVGQEEVLPALEQKVIGMHIDEEKEFVLEPDEAYGPATEPVSEMPLSFLPPGIVPEPQMVVVINDPRSGKKRFITILEVKDKSVVVDFNHPLAGKELHFRIKVLNIE